MQYYLCDVNNQSRGSNAKFESLLRSFKSTPKNTLKRAKHKAIAQSYHTS